MWGNVSWPSSAVTTSDRQMFNVYLGNIPADVILEDVKINGKLMMISGKTQPGLSITPLVYVNGSQAYELQLPFDNAIVHWTVKFLNHIQIHSQP